MTTNLAGLFFLVTRPLPQGLALCERIQALQGQALHFPTLAFHSLIAQPDFQQTLTQLGEQDWLIFNSPQAVQASIVAIRREWPQFPNHVKFAAVGKGTEHALRQAGYIVEACPETDWTSEGLLALPAFQAVSGKKIAIIRGQGGRGLLDQCLSERGAIILPVIAYQRVLPIVAEKTLDQLKQQPLSAIICTSFEGMQNLKTLIGEQIWNSVKNVPLIVPSERVKVLAQNSGYRTIWVSRNASHEAILEVICKKLR